MAFTPIFVAIFVLMFVGLSLNVIRFRLSKKVSLGDGDDRDLRVAIRMHGNFAEYIPIALILLWCVEQFTYNSGLVLILGSILFVARLAHVVGMQNSKKYFVLRQIGVLATHGVLIVGSIHLVSHYLPY
jgi:uncharacterized membrane protein YecN with MAPEG domain